MALERYLGCIENGKSAFDWESLRNGDELKAQGWKVEGWAERELEWTLGVWKDLVASIETRMPLSQTLQNEDAGDLLTPADILDQHPAMPSFVRAFLSRARKSSFAFIASHLRVPDEAFTDRIGVELTSRHPNFTLTDLPVRGDAGSPHFLLFPYATPGITFTSTTGLGRTFGLPCS